jgi:hypothetical protein
MLYNINIMENKIYNIEELDVKQHSFILIA